MNHLSRIMIIDEKKNSVIIDVSPQTLKMIGVKQEEIKKHKSRRQLILEMDEFLKNSQK